MLSIAIAEDHLHVRGTILSIINSLHDCRVTIESVNGFCLINQLNTAKHLPQIAIVDVEMPVMDGLAVTNFIHSQYPKIKILAVSSHNHPNIIIDMLVAGANGYLRKENLSPRVLQSAFADICSGIYFIDDTIANTEALLSAVARQHTEQCTACPEINAKEKIFLQLSATAISYEQIAGLMNVAKESIYNYQKSLKEKLGLGTRQEFMLYAIQHGIAKVAKYTSHHQVIHQ